MSSPSSLLLPENGDDWPIRMLVLLTPWALATPPANKQASAPTAAVNARIVVIALPPRLREHRPLKDRHFVYFMNFPPRPIIVRSTNFEPLWLVGEKLTTNSPRSTLFMPSSAATSFSRVRSLPARLRPSTITLATMNPSRLEKLKSGLPELAIISWYSFTTWTLGLHGKGTTCEIATPLPSSFSASASALLPTNDTLWNWVVLPL